MENKMIMKKYIVIGLVVLAGVSCSQADEKSTTQAPAANEEEVTFTDLQVKNAGIVTDTAIRQTLQSVLKVNGVVDVPPQNIVSVSFPMGGYLRTTNLLPGMHVRKGEVIGVMEDQSLIQLQQDYLMAASKLTYLQQEYERQKTLNEHKVNADKVFQQAASDYAGQKVLVKGLGEKLRLIGLNPDKLHESTISRSVPIHSPINGFVSKVNVNIGKFVSPTDVLFELINPDDMHAALTIFEKDLAKVKAGQKVEVSFVDDTTQRYDCEVIMVTRNVDESRSGLAHCHFESQPKNLLPGMFLTAAVQLGGIQSLTLPEEAVVRYGNKQYVFEVTGPNRFHIREVQTGITDHGRIEVAGEAIAGKPVVVKNAYAVLSKMKNTMDEE